MNNKPRVLVTSIPCWNNRTGSDTLSSLLEGYGENEVANIYFKSDTPNSPVCNNYFCISEGEVLRSVFRKKISTGKIIVRENEAQEHVCSDSELDEKRRYTFWNKHRSNLALLARELVWLLGKWDSKALCEFVENFNPEVLFFPIESYIYFNRVNEWLIRRTKCPAVGFIWDDNYTYLPQKGSLGFIVNRFLTRKGIKRLVKQCDTVFVISPKMKKEYDKLLGIDTVLLTKGTSAIEQYSNRLPSKPYHIVYAGKLLYGREQTLVSLAKVIEKVNQGKQKFFLDIYSQSVPSKSAMRYLNREGISCFHGKIRQDEVSQVLQQANLVLIAEALKGKNKNIARLSFSTKVTDCLGQGKCVMLIAPKDSASTEYLIENHAAVVASTETEIFDQLQKISANPKILEEYAKSAHELVHRNHSIEDKKKVLFDILGTCGMKYRNSRR